MKIYAVIFAIVIGVLFAGINYTKQSGFSPSVVAQTELTISAAISMKDVLAEIVSSYQQRNPNIKINFNFGGSGSLVRQIEEGAPVDIFISAAAKQMDDLAKQGLINKETRRNLIGNQLVLITPKESKLALNGFEDLVKSEFARVAIGAPDSVPAGAYTMQVFQNLNLVNTLAAKTIQAKDVRSVLAYVETGNVEAGVVYKTDAVFSNKVTIAATAPAEAHETIVYPAAVIASSKKAEAAGDFVTFLAGTEAQEIFAKYGFTKL